MKITIFWYRILKGVNIYTTGSPGFIFPLEYDTLVTYQLALKFESNKMHVINIT